MNFATYIPYLSQIVKRKTNACFNPLYPVYIRFFYINAINVSIAFYTRQYLYQGLKLIAEWVKDCRKCPHIVNRFIVWLLR